MTWMAASEERQQPPRKSYQRRQVSALSAYRTASPCSRNGIPKCAGTVSCKRGPYRTLSWGVGSQTPGLVHSPPRYTQTLTPRQKKMSPAPEKLFFAKLTPSSSLSSSRPLTPKPCEQPRFASPSLRHFHYANCTMVNYGNRDAHHICQPKSPTICLASLLHGHPLGDDLVDWKISRRRDDIGALVEFLLLLRDREAKNRQRIEEEAISLLDSLKQQERQERTTASFKELRLPVAQLKSLNFLSALRANQTSKYFVQQKEILKGFAGHTSARQWEDKKRGDGDHGVAVEQQLLIFDEEMAARSLIDIVEEGCRGRLMLAANNGTQVAESKGRVFVGIDEQIGEKRRYGPERPQLKEDASKNDRTANKVRHHKGESLPIGDSWGSADAHFDPLDVCVCGQALSTTASDTFLSASNDRFFFDGLGRVGLALANGAGEERDEEDDLRVVSSLNCRNGTKGERYDGLFVEEVGSEGMIERPEQSDVETFLDSEHAWLEEARAGLCLEEQEARAEIMQLEEYGIAHLEENRCNCWLSRHVSDAVLLQMENIIREEELRRIHICGSLLDTGTTTDSNVLSPRELSSSSHFRFRVGMEQREREALCNAFRDGLRTAGEAAIAALFEQEQQERAKLEREAQPKYTSVLWGMVSMGERQEILLEEQSEREGIEHEAVGHWMDLQLLHKFQYTRLLTGTGRMPPKRRESRPCSSDAEGNAYSWRSLNGDGDSDSDSDANSGVFLLLPSHLTQRGCMTNSKNTLEYANSTSEDNGSPRIFFTHGIQPEPEAIQKNCVAYSFSTLETEECEGREALHSDWRRGYENLLELDGMATNEFMRAIMFFDRMQTFHTSATSM
ncbi:hypothetical protein Tc00.1047053506811.70 [Trypanosoma cruzi]|uniref:Uncharacterized protein n=1 Tax=Trypanosoma cruzi (strain CL Brener) TaxID=353153 RepID=Q4DV09_TRYCC|nr:hypothetical protein Tc00.1047053506811.70 [Trypanosoma cruzi]EAN96353.1 hypothetical protein Tc00.1047053506811.70 [Trypanosoma cruzi]|eukprot:XP_818204.1 hypothetical protein [Trypanosoma cruzi strain CL Brener]